MVTCGADVLEMLSPSGSFLTEESRGEQRRRDLLPTREQRVLDAVPVVHPADSASVARTAGLPDSDVCESLLWLRGQGFVEESRVGWRLLSTD